MSFDDVTIADVMRAYAGDAVGLAARHGVGLDYSEQSLEIIDAMLAAMTADGFLDDGDSEIAENIWGIAKMFGGYVGEVAIRELGGGWQMLEDESGVTPVLEVAGIKGYPPETIYKRLTRDECANIGGYLRMIRAVSASKGLDQ